MTRTHKPSNWRAPAWQFDQAIYDEVVACYPPDVMKQIVNAARLERLDPHVARCAELAKVVEQNILNLGVWTLNWFKLADRPKPPQRKIALAKVQKAAASLHGALAKLDTDSSDDLRRVMLGDEFSRWALGVDPSAEIFMPLRGYAKFQTLFDITQRVEQWAVTAQKNTAKPKEGNLRADAKRAYAQGVIDIWLMIGHTRVSITVDPHDEDRAKGPLLDFTNAAARPLGLLPMLAALREAIALRKGKGEKLPR